MGEIVVRCLDMGEWYQGSDYKDEMLMWPFNWDFNLSILDIKTDVPLYSHLGGIGMTLSTWHPYVLKKERWAR